jgi:hypothetical protein
MAIENLDNRIALFSHEQDRVARALREMLPCVRDDRLHSDLAAMLQLHEINITRMIRSSSDDRPDRFAVT